MMMREEQSQRGDRIGPLAWGRLLPFAPPVSSVGLEWGGP
jgi:hypothetical protein